MTDRLDVSEIVKRSSALEQYWTARNERINEWMSLETLFDVNEEGGFESAVTNSPATVISMAVHLLSGQPVKHKVKVGGQADAAFRKAGILERALEGWWNRIDDAAFFSGRETFHRELAYWMTLTGWYSILLGVIDDGDDVMPLVDFHDPRTAFQQFGSPLDGLQSYVHKYETTLVEAQSLAERGGVSMRNVAGEPTQPIVIYDYFTKEKDKVLHAAAFGLNAQQGGEWLHYEEVINRDKIPILTGPVGGSPWRFSPRHSGTMGMSTIGVAEWQKRMGMSVLEANRTLWTQYNKYFSLLLEIAKNYAEPDKIRYRLEEGGERRVDIRQGGHVIDTNDPNSRITRDEPGRAPVEVLQIMEKISEQEQRGAFSHILYGATNLDISGFAISQLLQAALHKVGPYKTGIQRVLKEADRWFLDDFRTRDKTIMLSGNQAGSGIYLERFHSTDIPKEYAIEPDVTLAMPSDMMERVAIVRNAIPGNQPILDLLTALEEVVKVDDPRLVIDRIDENMLKQNPDMMRLDSIIAMKARAQALRADGKKEMAQMIDEYAEFLRLQANQVTGQGQGPSRGNGQDPRLLPPQAQGISPNAARRMRNPGAPNLLGRFNR